MKSLKPIERLFQEGLKDFQASPSQKVWDGIEEKLSDKKKHRRFIPLWWQAASVAAILLIFSFIAAFYNSSLGTNTQVSSKENSIIKPRSNSLEVIPTQYRFSSLNDNLSTFEDSIEKSLVFQITESKKAKPIPSSRLSSNPTDLVENNQTEENVFTSVNKLNRPTINSLSNNVIASTLISKESDVDLLLENTTSEKKSLFEAIEEDKLLVLEEDNTSLDSSWELRPNVAPVFMNSFNGGNPIEPSLQGKTSSNANVSFGVNVAYAINKKIKIRTGVNQVAMGYNTQDVLLSTTSSSFRAEGTSNLNSKNSIIGDVALVSATYSESRLRNSSMSNPDNALIVDSPISSGSIGVINHEIGFVEVPLEVEYAIINKKIGLHVLGGASTYLLNNNEIFFEDNGRSSSIGEADNLNSFSFSANLGVGMDYNFSKRVSFNLEPKFMYQINTFQSNMSDFQPYFFGIYSGLKLKF